MLHHSYSNTIALIVIALLYFNSHYPNTITPYYTTKRRPELFAQCPNMLPPTFYRFFGDKKCILSLALVLRYVLYL